MNFLQWVRIIFLFLSGLSGVSAVSIGWADEDRVFMHLGWDLEVSGKPLTIYMEQVVDHDWVEENLFWREGIFWREQPEDSPMRNALSILAIEDPQVLEYLPAHLKDLLLDGLSATPETEFLKEVLRQKNTPTLFGSDGKPLPQSNDSAIQFEIDLGQGPQSLVNSSGQTLETEFVKSIGLVDLQGQTLKRGLPEAEISEVEAAELETQKKLQHELSESKKRAELIRERWMKMIDDPKQAQAAFGKIPFKAYSPSVKAYLAYRSTKRSSIYLQKRPDLDFMDKVEITVDGSVLELKLDGTLTDERKYLSHLREVSKRLGLDRVVYQPKDQRGLKGGNLHIHGEFEPDILSKRELEVFMRKYKFKNALDSSFQTPEIFGHDGLNGYKAKFFSKGNVKQIAGTNHYEFREMTQSPDSLLREMRNYLGGLRSLPPDQRLNVAMERLDRGIIRSIQSDPYAFKKIFDQHLLPNISAQELGYLVNLLDPPGQLNSRGGFNDVYLSQVIKKKYLDDPVETQRLLKNGALKYSEVERVHRTALKEVDLRGYAQNAVKALRNAIQSGDSVLSKEHQGTLNTLSYLPEEYYKKELENLRIPLLSKVDHPEIYPLLYKTQVQLQNAESFSPKVMNSLRDYLNFQMMRAKNQGVEPSAIDRALFEKWMSTLLDNPNLVNWSDQPKMYLRQHEIPAYLQASLTNSVDMNTADLRKYIEVAKTLELRGGEHPNRNQQILDTLQNELATRIPIAKRPLPLRDPCPENVIRSLFKK